MNACSLAYTHKYSDFVMSNWTDVRL